MSDPTRLRDGASDPTVCVPDADGSCSICGDEGLVGRVVSVGPRRTATVRLATRPGPPVEVATDLVEEVRSGDRLVVHLGFAIGRVREEEAAAAAPEPGPAAAKGGR